MNKGLFLSLAATALLASCSSDEVLESVEPQAISFNSFVDKSTRAVTDKTTDNLSSFYVYAAYNGTTSVYNNEAVTKSERSWTPGEIKYWVAGKNYKFIAYSNGDAKISTIDDKTDFDKSSGNLTIKDYKADPSEPKDLILSKVVACDAVSANKKEAVSFTFSHLLTKVKFTITSGFGASSKMTISDLTFTANTTGTYTSNNATWNSLSASDAYNYNIASPVNGGQFGTDELYVIPQSNDINASFTVTVKDADDQPIGSKTFSSVSLKTDGGTWKAGYVYNYTATINDKNITMTADPIKFNVTKVDGWLDATTDEENLNSQIDPQE